MSTKKLQGLSFAGSEEVADQLYRPAPAVMDEPQPGYHVRAFLAAEGLVVCHGAEKVLFPLEEIMSLARSQMKPVGEPVIT